MDGRSDRRLFLQTPARVHAISEQDHSRANFRCYQQGGTREAGMPYGAARPIAPVDRVEPPPNSPDVVARPRLTAAHEGDRLGRQDAARHEDLLHKTDEVLQGGEEPSMTGHAAERVRIAVVDLAPYEPAARPLVPVQLRGRKCSLVIRVFWPEPGLPQPEGPATIEAKAWSRPISKQLSRTHPSNMYPRSEYRTGLPGRADLASS